ncbi:MAG: isochorismatase family protein [Thermoleophilia bacterium]|nr:isochorismatase family protein [Thermoleophilia bacterium]
MDLPQPSQAPRLLKIPARPEPLELDLARTALIVVDMQNAFTKKGGMVDLFGWDPSPHAPVIENHRRLIPACRGAGIKIVFIKMSYNRDYSDSGGPESPNWHKELALVLMRRHPEYWGRLITEGTWDEEIVEELKPEPGDTIVRKHRYSAFAGTELDHILKTYHIKYCIYSGLAANVCVESTLRDGFSLDYWPILVSDATNPLVPGPTYEATLWNVENIFGWVTTTDELIEAFAVD